MLLLESLFKHYPDERLVQHSGVESSVHQHILSANTPIIPVFKRTIGSAKTPTLMETTSRRPN
jgi:hypothetical protein